MKLKDFKIGDLVCVENKSKDMLFEAKVKCIHDCNLFLDHYMGSECNKHGGSWECIEKNGVLYSDFDSGEPLIMKHNFIHPLLNI